MSRSTGGVISDLDGTLVDTRAANTAAYAEAFGDVGLRFVQEEFDHAFGLAFDDMVDRLAPDADASARAALRSAKTAAYPRHLARAHVNTALVALLSRLREAGTPVALATTARRANVDAVLDRFGLTGLFDVVVTAEDVRRGKPDPECYLTAARLLQQRPEDCLVFEDSQVGVRAARAAGCDVIVVTL